MKYLHFYAYERITQTDEEPDQEALAEVDAGELDIFKVENGQFLYAKTKVELDKDDQDEDSERIFSLTWTIVGAA